MIRYQNSVQSYYGTGYEVHNSKFQTIKLNNFKNYTDAAGLTRVGVNLTEDDWSINSTTTYV